MVITVPTIKKILNEKNEVIRKIGELQLEIDTSFKADLKWEEHFKEAVGYNLQTYLAMVNKWKLTKETARTHFIGMLKLLYCYVNSDKLPHFDDFAGLFDYEIADQVLSKISIVLEQIGKTASKN